MLPLTATNGQTDVQHEKTFLNILLGHRHQIAGDTDGLVAICLCRLKLPQQKGVAELGGASLEDVPAHHHDTQAQ